MALEPSEEEKIRSLIKLFLHWNNGVVFALQKGELRGFKSGGWGFPKRLSLNYIFDLEKLVLRDLNRGKFFDIFLINFWADLLTCFRKDFVIDFIDRFF